MGERDDSTANALQVRIVSIPAPTDADLASINGRFPLTALAPEDIFTFGIGISSDAYDSYFTRMDPDTTLENFVEDFRAGQALLDTHDQYSLDGLLGRSFDATREIVPAGQLDGARASKRVVARWYMRRGLKTNEIIADIMAGIINRSSVGFGGNELWLRSDEDGKDMYESQFYPGMPLPPNSYGGKKRATFTIVDGRALEGSLVFKNSTPGADGAFVGGGRVAAVLARVADLAARDEIPRADLAWLAGTWGVRLAGASPRWAGGTTGGRAERLTTEEDDMSYADLVQVRVGKKFSTKTRTRLEELAGKGGEIKEGLTELLADVVEEAIKDERTAGQSRLVETRAAVVVALGEIGIKVEGDDQDVPAAIRAAQASLEDTRRFAVDGRKYRDDLVVEALAQGVRAHGQSFAKETYEPMLRSASLDVVQQMLRDWQVQGDKRIPTGRSTTDGDESGDGLEQRPTGTTGVVVDMSAYRVNG